MADHSDDLDQLLDSALDDFQTLNLSSSVQRNSDSDVKEQRTSSIQTEVRGLGMGLPDLKSKKKGKHKVSKDSHVTEALDKMREQTREAVKGLESTAGLHPGLGIGSLDNDPMMEELAKQFEALAGSQDMDSIVETMMQQLLSKEILHEPMKEIGERYPKWLDEHQSTLDEDEYERFSNQYKYIKELIKVYDTEPSNFGKIVELMQKMQECGQPPNDIMTELAPDFDLSSFGQLSPEMLGSQQNCSIM